MGTVRLALAAALMAALPAPGPVSLLTPSAVAQEGKAGRKGAAKKVPPKEGEKKESRKRLSVGDEVGKFTLALLDGGSWKASSARGKVVVLVFAAEGFPESLEALKTLGKATGKNAAKTAKSGASLLGVIRDAEAKKARKVARDNSLTVKLALDPKRKAYDRLARAGLPYTVVIDGKGRIALSTSGFDDAVVAKKVEESKKVKEPEKAKEPGKK